MLDKAERDLATLRVGTDEPLDVIFNLVTTIDHVWDWVTKDMTVDERIRAQAHTLPKRNQAVAAIHALSVAAKHLDVNLDRVTPPATDVDVQGWGTMPWGEGPWGGAVRYLIDVGGNKRRVDDVAEEALNAWRVLLLP